MRVEARPWSGHSRSRYTRFPLRTRRADRVRRHTGHRAEVCFQNENIYAAVDGEILATVPDLICMVDTDTFIPVTTEALKYGKRVLVVGLKCYEMWRSEAGLELVSPRYFGVDTDYIPIEERVKGGAANV